MYLYELVEQYGILTQKIKELKRIFLDSQDNSSAEEIMTLMEEQQALLIKISRANNKSTIRISDTDISVANAIIIRNTLDEKVDLLTELIGAYNSSLDKLSLMKQRDRFFKEYLLIDMLIKKNDLNVTVGD